MTPKSVNADASDTSGCFGSLRAAIRFVTPGLGFLVQLFGMPQAPRGALLHKERIRSIRSHPKHPR